MENLSTNTNPFGLTPLAAEREAAERRERMFMAIFRPVMWALIAASTFAAGAQYANHQSAPEINLHGHRLDRLPPGTRQCTADFTRNCLACAHRLTDGSYVLTQHC